LDFLCFYATFALGLFTLSLIYQTTYYIYRQTSLIDQTKRARHNREIRKKRGWRNAEDDSEEDEEKMKKSLKPKEM